MIPWERNREFQTTERILQEHKIVDIANHAILDQTAFDDLLLGLFSAWALKAIGREKYVLFFHALDASHTLLVVQRAPSFALRPSRRAGLFADDFWHTPEDLRALQGKLLFNAGAAPEAGLLDEINLDQLASPAKLRAFVTNNTLREPARYGWLWGGQAILLNVSPPIFQAMLTAAKQTRNLLCESFEQALCLHLGLTLQSSFFSCHIKQTTPVKFSETDIVLCHNDAASTGKGLWTPDCGRDLKDEVQRDRVFILESSSGVMETEPAPRRSEVKSDTINEPETHWHPKLINWLALRHVGFAAVRLHLCSLVAITIDNEALDFAVRSDPHITRHHLGARSIKSIRDGTWTPASLREAGQEYCCAALESARAAFADSP